MCLLRAQACEALDNKSRAVHWYCQAIQKDPFCYEALSALVDNHMLTNGYAPGTCQRSQVLPGMFHRMRHLPSLPRGCAHHSPTVWHTGMWCTASRFIHDSTWQSSTRLLSS